MQIMPSSAKMNLLSLGAKPKRVQNSSIHSFMEQLSQKSAKVNSNFEVEYNKFFNDNNMKNHTVSENSSLGFEFKTKNQNTDDFKNPYTENIATQSLYAPEPVRLISDELEQLANKLQADNVSSDALNVIRSLQDKVGGTSIDELMTEIKQVMQGGEIDLNDQEISTLQSLSNKLSPEDPDTLYSALRYSSAKQGFEAISDKLKETSVSLTQAEIAVVGKALDLDLANLQGLMKKAEDFAGKNLTPKDVDQLFSNAKAFIEYKQDENVKLEASLEKNLKPVVQLAENREKFERQSSMLQDKSVAQVKTLMEDVSITRALGDQLNRDNIEKDSKSEKSSFEAKSDVKQVVNKSNEAKPIGQTSLKEQDNISKEPQVVQIAKGQGALSNAGQVATQTNSANTQIIAQSSQNTAVPTPIVNQASNQASGQAQASINQAQANVQTNIQAQIQAVAQAGTQQVHAGQSQVQQTNTNQVQAPVVASQVQAVASSNQVQAIVQSGEQIAPVQAQVVADEQVQAKDTFAMPTTQVEKPSQAQATPQNNKNVSGNNNAQEIVNALHEKTKLENTLGDNAVLRAREETDYSNELFEDKNNNFLKQDTVKAKANDNQIQATNDKARDFEPKTSERSSEQSFTRLSSEAPAPSLNLSSASIAKEVGQEGNIFRQATSTQDAPKTNEAQFQVQNSILNMAKNGTKVLEVSLNPVELGQLQLTLSAVQGELNVVVKAEKAESASMINTHMDAIRAELENQGFKVENISVEVGLNKDTRQEWHGMNSHNSNQENFENAQYFDRLRQLSKLNNAGQADLARNMHNIEYTADNAQSGLHVVA